MQWTPGIYKSKSRIPDWPKTFGSLSTFKKSAQFITSFLGSQELKGHGHFWLHPPPKSLNQLLALLNLYQDEKNQFIPFVHFWGTVNFRFPWPDWPHPFLTMPTQKMFDQHLILWICINMHKISLFHLFLLQIQLLLELPHQTGHAHFNHAHSKNFQLTFDLEEFVPACKNSVNSISSFLRYIQTHF